MTKQSIRAARGAIVVVLAWCAFLPSTLRATPSSTYWAPSTASCQAWAVPHVTYDTYFWKGPAAGSAGAPNYPMDAGLTVGFLPFKTIQGEAGFDVLLPSEDPLYFNAKLGVPESVMFKRSPAVSFGIYNVGTRNGVTDYNVLDLMFQESLPGGSGYVAVGVYYGLNADLFVNSDGAIVRSGAMVGFVSPDIVIDAKGLKKITIAADVQTGKNVLGAWGAGANFYFTDTISLLTGPVFYLDPALQPGSSNTLWTLQLDIDIPIGRK
jgi:hypothetical protein